MSATTLTETTSVSECSLQQLYKTTETKHRKAATGRANPTYLARLQDEPKFMKPLRDLEMKLGFETPIIWTNAIFITLFHVAIVTWTLYYIRIMRFPKWQTIAFSCFMGQAAGFGVTGGAHRLWCHRAYRAARPLQLILLVCYSAAGQNTIFDWVRDHRVHHSCSETAADPHDARRGFFFSHVGWLMMRKHPAVVRAGAELDMSDIADDPLCRFHAKYFTLFKLAFCFVLPTLAPALCWGEAWDLAALSQLGLRYLCSLNFTWSVNSFAHMWGGKPYDRNIMPSENWAVSLVAMGEGWHNYHHTFPWDYKAAELGYTLNTTTLLLDMFARIGWAYNLKQASPVLVESVAARKGWYSRH